MTKTKIISLETREKELKGLVKDAQKMNFNPQLTKKYQRQHAQVMIEIKEIRSKRKRAIQKDREFKKIAEGGLGQEFQKNNERGSE